ncbi:MAG: LytR family transcriptional regulator, partial [Chloroflexi bacterium]
MTAALSGYPVAAFAAATTNPRPTDELPMTRRDSRRVQVSESPRARRIREAIKREDELRARGIDPYAVARGSGGGGSRQRPGRAPPRPVRLKRIALTVLVVLLVLVFGGGFLLWQRVSAFNDAVSSAPSASSSLFFPLIGSDRVNVAMYGYGGSEQPAGTYLADSINIISIDPQTDMTTTIPIPRDLWITGFSELPKGGKVNEVFADGFVIGGVDEAGRLATGLLSEVTGLKIEHWMAIDFAGFKAMVDAAGGVTFYNPTAFSYTTNEDRYRAGVFDAGTFAAGTLSLNGQQALMYSRARYTSVPAEASDFARSVRQSRVLAALRAKLGSGGIGALGPGLALMDALNGRMHTDLSAIDLYLLSGHLAADRRIELAEDVILEAARNEKGQYV